MLASRLNNLQRIMDRLNTISAKYEMKINTKKIKVMKISRKEETVVRMVKK